MLSYYKNEYVINLNFVRVFMLTFQTNFWEILYIVNPVNNLNRIYVSTFNPTFFFKIEIPRSLALLEKETRPMVSVASVCIKD